MNYQQSYGKTLEKPNELEFFILLLYYYRLMVLGRTTVIRAIHRGIEELSKHQLGKGKKNFFIKVVY